MPAIVLFAPLIYAFFLNLMTMIELKPNSGSYFTDSPSVRESMDELIGLVFSGISLQFVVTLFVFSLHSLASAVIMGSFIFLLLRDEDPKKLEDFIEEEQDFVSEDEINQRNKSSKGELLRASKLIMLVPFLQILLQLLQVILLNESFGVNYLWSICWLILWVFLSILAVVHNHLFVNSLKNGGEKPKIIFFSCLNFVVIVLTTFYILYEEFVYLSTIGDYKTILLAQIFLFACTYFSFSLLSYLIMARLEANGKKKKRKINQIKEQENSSPEENNNEKNSNKNFILIKLSIVWDWLTEKHLKQLEKVPGRRIFLLLGIIGMTGLLLNNSIYIFTTNAETMIDRTMASFGINLQWPSGQTIFTPAIHSLRTAMQIGVVMGIIGWIFLLMSLRSNLKDDLKESKFFVYCGAFFIVLQVLAVPSVNYLSKSNLASICPFCAPKFNRMVQFASQNLIGLLICAAIMDNFILVIVSIPIAFVRASTLMMSSISDKSSNSFRSLRQITLVSSLSTVPLTLIIGLAFYQISMSNKIVLFLLCCFWFIPLCWIYFAYRHIEKKRATLGVAPFEEMFAYYVWIALYLGTLVVLTLQQIFHHKAVNIVVDALKSKSFYFELVAEICISNVVISDILYQLLSKKNKEEKKMIQEKVLN